jgi:hypothetical protein
MQLALGIALVTVGVAWLGAWIMRLARQPRRTLGESMPLVSGDAREEEKP